ncbi:MAG: type II secretion system major pseudopilin GspG [Candidatus Omnitrophica bacterium]|nr:type II secretion system major pseudopilin GspG [Candidatus Omnitrophota bacterium]
MLPNPHTQLKNRSGFTFVEIMIVVIIIAALSAMVVPRLSGRSERAKENIARADIETNLATALKLYELDNGHFPTTDQGLMALRVQPSSNPEARNWNGPYIEKDPLDPWGNPYVYRSPGKKGPDYDLSSRGKNLDAQDDDITNWN